MSVQSRKDLMMKVVASPEAYGKKVGKVLPFAPSVASFLAAAKSSGSSALARGTTRWTDHGRYREMSIRDPAYRPSAKVGEFFANLFKTVSAQTGHELTKYDLWHGHLVKPWGKKFTCVLFHAKEYPNDLNVELAGAPFSTRHADFVYRNVLWLESDYGVYKLDASDGTKLFKDLIKELAQVQFGILGQNYVSNSCKARMVSQEYAGESRIDAYYLCNERPGTAESDKIVLTEAGTSISESD